MNKHLFLENSLKSSIAIHDIHGKALSPAPIQLDSRAGAAFPRPPVAAAISVGQEAAMPRDRGVGERCLVIDEDAVRDLWVSETEVDGDDGQRCAPSPGRQKMRSPSPGKPQVSARRRG